MATMQDSIQAELTRLAKLLKRADVEVAVLLRPAGAPRFAVRLGEQGTWIKDVNPIEVFDFMSKAIKPDDYYKEVKTTIEALEQAKKTSEVVDAINRWMEHTPASNPPF